MSDVLPLLAPAIGLVWITKFGCIGMAAYTDHRRRPYIGLYPVNRDGKPLGLPCWMQRTYFITDVVLGFDNKLPVISHLDIEVTSRGLHMVATRSWESPLSYAAKHRTFVPWNSESPRLGFTTGEGR